MTSLRVALWLLSIAGLALLFGLVAAGLRQNSAFCAASDTGLGQMGLGQMGMGRGVRLSGAMAGLRLPDLLIGMVCLMPLAVMAARSYGHRQWVLVLATVGFAALLPVHLLREYGPSCAAALDLALATYLFPAALVTLLAWRVSETLAARAGQ